MMQLLLTILSVSFIISLLYLSNSVMTITKIVGIVNIVLFIYLVSISICSIDKVEGLELSSSDISSITIVSQDIKEKNNNIKIVSSYRHIPMEPNHIIFLVNLSYYYDIDPDLVLALIWCESNFNPLAKNRYSSASGYSQMIKSTALSCVKNIDNIKDYNHKIHAFDPYINLHLMIYYISNCVYSSNGDIDKVLLSYRGCKDSKYFRMVKERMNIIKSKKIKNKKS